MKHYILLDKTICNGQEYTTVVAVTHIFEEAQDIFRSYVKEEKQSDWIPNMTIIEDSERCFEAGEEDNFLWNAVHLKILESGDGGDSIEYFDKIYDALSHHPTENYRAEGGEILAKTEQACNDLADLIESLYMEQDEEVLITTGYYDPAEDEKTGEVDSFTGWYYIDMQ